MGMNTAAVQRLYVAYFNRPADPVSLAVYEAMLPTDRVATQAELQVIAETYFSPSAEYTTNFAGKSNSQIVDQLYQNIFGRSAEAEGLISWASKLTDGSITVAELALQLSYSAQGTDAAVVNARIEAATTFTDGLDTAAEITGYSGNAAAAAGRVYLAQISGELPTTAEAVTTQKDAAIAGVGASITSAVDADTSTSGSTFTLTTSAETLNGTAGDDSFVAVVTGLGASGTTILPGDILSGGSGTDTLTISTAGNPGAAYTIAAIQASGIEKILVNGFDIDATADGTDVDLTLMGTAVQEVGLASSSANGDVVFTNPKSIIDASMANGAGDLKITYGAVATGSSDVQDLTLTNVSAGTATFASVETVNVTSSLVKSTLTDLVIDGASTLNISGDAALKITNDVDFKDATLSTAVDGTVDASGLSGALTFTPNTSDNVTITGGSGDDVINMSTGLDAYDTIVGGAGSDTVSISLAAATGAETAFSSQLATLSGIETLDVTSTNDAASVSMGSVSSDVSKITLGSNVKTYQVTAVANSTAITFTLNGTSYTTAATDGSATVAEAATLIQGVIDGLSGFSASVSTDTVTITATSGNAVEISAPTGGATAATIGAYTDAGVTNLASDNSQVVEIHTGNDISVGLADGSASTDSVSLSLGTVKADKGVAQTINQITVNNTETLNIEVTGRTDTVDTVVTTLTADADLTTLNITGESDLDLSGTITASKLTTIDASASTGDIKTDVVAVTTAGSTVKGGSGKDNFIFGSGLDSSDTVDGGDGADVLSATISGFSGASSSKGDLTVANVETLNLTATTSADLDASGITGATQISLSGAQAGTSSITNLAAGVAVGFGIYKTDGASTGRTDIALADATGAADAIDLVLNDTAAANTNSIELRASGIETANISFGYDSTLDTALANHSLDVDKLNVSTINVTGSTYDTTNTLSLNTLDTDTTTVDASGYGGILTATAGTAIATSFTVKADRTHTLVGSSKNDTFVLSGSHTNSDVSIDGNGGTDTLTMTLGTGAQDFDSITDVDTINLIVSGSAAITTNADTAVLDGLNEASSVVVTGGNSLSTFALGGGTDTLTGGSKNNVYDFSGYSGAVTATFAGDGFDDGELGYTQQFIGTGSTADAVTASYTNADDTVVINMQDVAILNLAVGNGSALNANFAKVTGLSEINFTDASGESVTFTSLDLGTTVDATTTNNTQVTITAADATGSADQLNVKAKAGSADDVLKLVVADVETVSVKADSANQVNLDVSGVTMTATGATAALAITGANDIEISADNADITSIDASANTGGVIQTARSATGAFTATGGVAADTFIMRNPADVLAGGLGTDTLDINFEAILGGVNVDLSSTTNQIVSMNGSAPTGTVTGFENVDVSGYTGTMGAQITAVATGSTITGTANVDAITLGLGVDTVNATDAVASATTFKVDVITGFTAGSAGDKIKLSLSDIEALTAVTDLVEGDASSVAAGDTIVVETIVKGSTETLVAGDNIFAITGGTYADVDTLVADLDGGGTTALTFGANPTAKDSIIAIWSDGTDAYISVLSGSDATDSAAIDDGELAGYNLVKLAGITSITDAMFAAANFDFVA